MGEGGQRGDVDRTGGVAGRQPGEELRFYAAAQPGVLRPVWLGRDTVGPGDDSRGEVAAADSRVPLAAARVRALPLLDLVVLSQGVVQADPEGELAPDQLPDVPRLEPPALDGAPEPDQPLGDLPSADLLDLGNVWPHRFATLLDERGLQVG